ncbi:MAG: DNA polymerase III subunit gamma/tau [Patescibacteria group bacterium]
MAFYRTYRPQVIGEIDNKDVQKALLSLLSKDRKSLPHAFFFSGPKGSGKTTAARLIAKLFLCEKLGRLGPCGSCPACASVTKGSAIDLIEIDAASNRGIDEIRSLRDGIGLSPSIGEFKVYIIDEVHMLTNEAFNALLKTLEEPPLHAVFVLATTDPQKVPSTILSRCMHIKFARAGKKELVTVLQRIAKKEKLKFTDEIFDLIADVADGSFRDAVKLLEQVSFFHADVTLEDVRTLLSVSDSATQTAFIKALAEKNAKEALGIVGRLVADGSDIKQFTTQILYALEKHLVQSVSGNTGDTSWSKESLLSAIEELSHAFSSFRFTPIMALPVEVAIAHICTSQMPPATEEPRPASIARTVSVKEVEHPISKPHAGDKPLGLLTIERLTEHWSDVITAAKPMNHSIAGVLRSSRPHAVSGSVVSIEAFYPFHQEKLSEPNVRAMLSELMKNLFGEKVTVEIVLGKK